MVALRLPTVRSLLITSCLLQFLPFICTLNKLLVSASCFTGSLSLYSYMISYSFLTSDSNLEFCYNISQWESCSTINFMQTFSLSGLFFSHSITFSRISTLISVFVYLAQSKLRYSLFRRSFRFYSFNNSANLSHFSIVSSP